MVISETQLTILQLQQCYAFLLEMEWLTTTQVHLLCAHQPSLSLSTVSLGDAGVKVRDVLTLTEAHLPYRGVWGLCEG